MHRRLAPLALLFAACFTDSGYVGDQTGAGTGGAVTGDPSTPTGDPQGTGTASGATDDAGSGTGPQTTTTDASATATATTDQTTDQTSASTPSCGDGQLDPGEACDDGNGVDDDGCQSDCTLPGCSDQVLDNGESDIDCGGPCTPCTDCRQCVGDADCAAGLACMDQRCRHHADMVIDWQIHCGTDTQPWAQGPDLPAGDYTIFAQGGGGSSYDDPPSWRWTASCEGLDFGIMFTEMGYASPADAFDALPVKQIDSPYPGGLLRCGIFDIFCADNLGSESFAVVQACP